MSIGSKVKYKVEVFKDIKNARKDLEKQEKRTRKVLQQTLRH